MSRNIAKRVDWISVLIYIILVAIGWVSIYATNYTPEKSDIFNFSEFHAKQLIFIVFSLIIAVMILSIEVRFYERFSSLFYMISLLLLVGLFVFGKKIN